MAWKTRKTRYNYLYSKEELMPWVDKVKQISSETAVVRGYFNNHYGARAVVNALEFKEMLSTILSEREKIATDSPFLRSNRESAR